MAGEADTGARWRGVWLAMALTAASLGACTLGEPCRPRVIEEGEGFDRGLERWTVLRGSARATTSIHSAEPAARLEGDSTIETLALATSRPITRVDLVAACESDTQLRLTLISFASGADGGSATEGVALDLPRTEGVGALVHLSENLDFVSGLRRLRVSSVGPGSCLVDEIFISSIDEC